MKHFLNYLRKSNFTIIDLDAWDVRIDVYLLCKNEGPLDNSYRPCHPSSSAHCQNILHCNNLFDRWSLNTCCPIPKFQPTYTLRDHPKPNSNLINVFCSLNSYYDHVLLENWLTVLWTLLKCQPELVAKVSMKFISYSSNWLFARDSHFSMVSEHFY